MADGVDYSFSRPSPACLRRQGHEFVVRYLSASSSAKNLDAHELARLWNAGLAVVLVYQDGTSDMLRGHAEGVRDAHAAKAGADALDWPTHRPIYFALDQDPGPLSTAQIGACRLYLDGAASVLGRQRVGVYAGYRGIELLCPRWAPWGWQTYAWSRGRISDRAHFRQYRNGVRLCGGDVDLNETYRADFGQWPTGTSQPDPPNMGDDDMSAEAERKIDAIYDALVFAGKGTSSADQTWPRHDRFQIEIVRNSRKIQTGQEIYLHAKHAMLEALAEREHGQIPEDDLEAIAEFVASATRAEIDELAPAIADEIVSRTEGGIDQETVEAGVRAVLSEGVGGEE